MATERQIAANQRNAALSTGPKTDQGKAASRANATKHGMACESADVESSLSPAFQARRAEWASDYRPSGVAQSWALDRMVAASIQIERCERTMESVIETSARRARLVWDQDRTLDAAKLMARLASNPTLIAAKLQSTYQGVNLMLDWWTRLDEALKAGEDWTDAQASMAMDLLGIPTQLRSGRTPIDDPADGPAQPYRQKLVADEIHRLEQLQDAALEFLDNLERRHAITGDMAMLSAPAKLIQRYERAAWRRFNESARQMTAPEPQPQPEARVVPTPPTSAPVPKEEPCDEEEEAMIEAARANIAATMRELGIEGYPPGLDLYLARNQVDGTNPIGCGSLAGGLPG